MITAGDSTTPVAIPVIIGPTAAGKTSLSLALARENTRIEIISADSRQIYIGLDIGTAKPPPEALRDVPHHMIDILPPDESYSAGRFAARARVEIAAVLERGNIPLVVGGSGFYLKALFQGLSAPTIDPEVYAWLMDRLSAEGYDALFSELQRVDPIAAGAHSSSNQVKALRALCCYHQTGAPYSSFLQPQALPPGALDLRPSYLGIAPPRATVYARIDQRTIAMVEEGLLNEVKGLLAAGYTAVSPGLQTMGYAEALRHLAGELALPTMIALIQMQTRRYAKRQLTWFRRVEGITWMETPDAATIERWWDGAASGA